MENSARNFWLLGQDSNPSADGNPSVDGLTAAFQALPNPLPTPPTLEFSLTAHRLRPRLKRLLMHQPPRTRVALRMKCPTILRIIMLSEADGQLARLPNINLSLRVQQNIHPEAHRGIIRFGSSARTRTWNPSVNSRMLYH